MRNSGESNTRSRNEECSAGDMCSYALISQIKIYYGFAGEGVVACGVAIMDSSGSSRLFPAEFEPQNLSSAGFDLVSYLDGIPPE